MKSSSFCVFWGIASSLVLKDRYNFDVNRYPGKHFEPDPLKINATSLIADPKVKVKESRKRPGVAHRFPGSIGSQIRHARMVRLSASLTGRLYSQECSWYSFSLGAESTPGPWKGRKEMSLKNPVTSPGIDPGTVRLVEQRLIHYATPGPLLLILPAPFRRRSLNVY